METKQLKKDLRALRDSIDDFLDNMDMDAEEAVSVKKPEKKDPKKDPDDVEEDEDGKKKEH